MINDIEKDWQEGMGLFKSIPRDVKALGFRAVFPILCLAVLLVGILVAVY